MESKEEIRDAYNGIILHSGLGSTFIVSTDMSTHTRAVKLKQKSLQDKIELCVLELKKLCIREAELTGHLCSNYPLLPGEKPPQIRKRIGAAFKLEDQSILHRGKDTELCSMEAKLALQQQIYAHRLCHEECLSKAVKTSRKQQCKHEEQKLKELQDSVFQLHLEYGHSSTQSSISTQKYHGTEDNSSSSDSAVLDEEDLMSQSSKTSSEPSSTEFDSLAPDPTNLSLNPSVMLFHPQEANLSLHKPSLEHLQPCHCPSLEHDPAPIQNSPWKESSLDQPYEKQKSHFNSISSRVTSRDPPNNAQQERGWSHGPRRRLTDVNLTTHDYSPEMLAMGNTHHSSSEESNTGYLSAPSYCRSPCQKLLAEPEQLCQAQHRYHYSNHLSGSYLTHSYETSLTQLYPSMYKGYINEGRAHYIDLNSMYIRCQPSPCTSGQYEYLYEEAPVQQQVGRLNHYHLKLSRPPSLRDYPQHPSRVLPRQVVSDELKSWHQRCQLRPQSLEKQATVGIWNLPSYESPLSHHHDLYYQVP